MTASQAIFKLPRVIFGNIPGNNIVTTALEHPSAYDAVKFYADKLGKAQYPFLVAKWAELEVFAGNGRDIHGYHIYI